ncbi:autotransporter assembly complex protein TamA [Cupriavidus plantarum]|uniref:autotransporter assembly complex protein TamA n=1 Tax=Cupriavidus plantarum TaxID=942865 RepID=UPI000E257EBC|nr:autotransporter secretion outer membrane protein TamA [Cupriavidus plantarum]RLK44349.1 autotransporter secretion outer membrane protein TamA [Cupriavidus plantarum]CAG2142661.1 Translocation and assembly module subunit TamA [Cupriavidus plantarum]SMR65550.1 autotransporter secretion outer membrane protein TamA [Cupriavidus plantarum]
MTRDRGRRAATTLLLRLLRPPRAASFPRAALVLLCACALHAAPAAATYKVEVDAPKPLEDILKEHLDLARYASRTDLSDDQFQYMVETVGDQVRQFASTEGWFDPTTTARVEGEGNSRVVHVTVDAGARTLIRSVDVSVTGPAATQSPEQVAEMRAKWGLPVGDPFRQSDWDKAKEDALLTLQSKSYYGAKLASSRARVEADEHAADLTAKYDSGPAYILGPVRISGTRRYPEQIIRNVNPLSEGEPYRVERLLELQRAIQNQPYFSNAQVDLEDPEPDADKPGTVIAPVSVRVREYPVHRLTSGVGFTTDTGAQVEGRYSYYNLFNRAWVFDSQARIEQKRQYAFLETAMPPDSHTYRNSLYGSYERTIDIESTDLTSWRTGLKRSRSREKYDTTWSLDFYYDNLLPYGQEAQISKALVPAFAWTRRDVDNPVFPRRGNVINTQVGVAAKHVLSDATFLRLYGRIRQYVPVGTRDLFIARLELGADLTSSDPAKVPASLRFRAGGTDSIRGYSYQSIGTPNGASVLPARYLGTGSLEYQYWFKPDWGVAVFWDVGTATNSIQGITLYNGVGVGARWRSPVGPLQLDLGYGIQQNQFRPHISLGVAF